MKFICEKCNTKYSIADSKVRRKVLKIRCKNCSEIIVVREPASDAAADSQLSRTIPDNPQAPPQQRSTSNSKVSALFSATSLDHAPNLDDLGPEPTRLSTVPAFLDEPPGGPGNEWYLAVDGAQFGPMAFSELCSRVKRGETGSEAFAWQDGFEDWLEITQIPELKPFVPRHPPPPPGYKSGLMEVVPMSMRPTATNRPEVPQVPPLPQETGSGLFPSSTPQAMPPLPGPQHQSFAGPINPPAPAPPTPAPQAPNPPTQPVHSVPTPAMDVSQVGPHPNPAAAASPRQESELIPMPAAPESPGYPIPQQGTPLVMKVTAAAGIVAAVCGIILLVYFLFIDRPAQDPQVAANLVTGIDPKNILVDPEPQEPDAAVNNVGMEFSPMELVRSKGGKATGASRGKAPGPASAGATPSTSQHDNLSKEQKRLMALYGKGGNQAGRIPSSNVKKRRRSTPVRQITASEVMALQKKHRVPISSCYQRALKRDNTLTELKATVTVTITDSGQVKGLEISGSDSTDLVSCLTKNMRHWMFPAAGQQTFKFPIIFRGQ